MLRHKKTVHANESVGREKHTKEVVSDDSSTEESDMETDLDEKEEETIDPWFDLVQHTFNTLQPDFDATASELLEDGDISEKEARKRAFAELLPKYRKYLINRYIFRVLWFDSMRSDPIHRTIKRAAKRLTEEDDYDSDESWKYAINKRKYLFDKLFKQYELPGLQENR